MLAQLREEFEARKSTVIPEHLDDEWTPGEVGQRSIDAVVVGEREVEDGVFLYQREPRKGWMLELMSQTYG